MSETTATIHTNVGDIVVELFPNHAPKTVANFVGLANGTREYSAANAKGTKTGPFFDGSIFHRVIDGFMIQGGDPTGTGRGGPGYQFADEFHGELSVRSPIRHPWPSSTRSPPPTSTASIAPRVTSSSNPSRSTTDQRPAAPALTTPGPPRPELLDRCRNHRRVTTRHRRSPPSAPGTRNVPPASPVRGVTDRPARSA